MLLAKTSLGLTIILQPDNLARMKQGDLRIAHADGQVVGQKSDYYVTLEQLETICKNFGVLVKP